MGKCKIKAIQTDLGTFRDNQAYPGIIQTYSKPCVTLTYSEPEVYSKPWHIHNPGIFRMLAYSKCEAYSEPCQTTLMKHFAKTVNGYNYFSKACCILYSMK